MTLGDSLIGDSWIALATQLSDKNIPGTSMRGPLEGNRPTATFVSGEDPMPSLRLGRLIANAAQYHGAKVVFTADLFGGVAEGWTRQG